MFKSQIRDANLSQDTIDKYYQLVFITVVDLTEKTLPERIELIKRWCEFAHTDYEKIKHVYRKIHYSTYAQNKKAKMRALAYFGVSIKDVKEIFGISANYQKTANGKDIFTLSSCNAEEMTELRNTIDRLMYLLWFFRYLKFDDEGIVILESSEHSKQFICEMFFKTAIFYYSRRYKQLFPEALEVRPLNPLCKFLDFSTLTANYVYSVLIKQNIYINVSDVRSLLYYSLGISIKDSKELLIYKQPAFHYRSTKTSNKKYGSVLNEQDYLAVEDFLKRLYKYTKYLCCLKGVKNKDE